MTYSAITREITRSTAQANRGLDSIGPAIKRAFREYLSVDSG
jgi:hypothetical protein